MFAISRRISDAASSEFTAGLQICIIVLCVFGYARMQEELLLTHGLPFPLRAQFSNCFDPCIPLLLHSLRGNRFIWYLEPAINKQNLSFLIRQH